jgi:hypothetical protein
MRRPMADLRARRFGRLEQCHSTSGTARRTFEIRGLLNLVRPGGSFRIARGRRTASNGAFWWRFWRVPAIFPALRGRPVSAAARINVGCKAYEVAFKWAETEAAQVLEDEARRRAFEGVPKGVYYRGALVGYERKYSDRLLVQLLKAHPPITLWGTNEDGAFCHENLARLTEEQVVGLHARRASRSRLRSPCNRTSGRCSKCCLTKSGREAARGALIAPPRTPGACLC